MLGGPTSIDLLLDAEWLRARAFSPEQRQQLLVLNIRQDGLDLSTGRLTKTCL